jgi:hypothetical protein
MSILMLTGAPVMSIQHRRGETRPQAALRWKPGHFRDARFRHPTAAGARTHAGASSTDRGIAGALPIGCRYARAALQCNRTVEGQGELQNDSALQR